MHAFNLEPIVEGSRGLWGGGGAHIFIQTTEPIVSSGSFNEHKDRQNVGMTQDTPPLLLLVDGSSYLYRAFHAMPDLRAKPGDAQSQPTGAIRGMINMMESLKKDYPSSHAACVFDAK